MVIIINYSMQKLSDIHNRIKQPSNCCIYCGKEYKKKSNYDKHLLFCEIIYRSKERKNKVNDDDEEIFVLPTPKKMYFMLLEMADKYNKLEEKMEQMTKWVRTENNKKKINLLEWLNNPSTHNKPEFTFDEMINKVIIIDSDIEYLFHHSTIETINEIFTHSLYSLGNSDSGNILPLQMFTQKNNLFYIYNKNLNHNFNTDFNNNEIICWHELSKEKLIKFLNSLHLKIVKAMSEWRKKNKDKINESDSCAIIYDKAFAKLMNIDFKCDSTLNKIKSMIYSNMKTDVKNIIEYDIQF